LQFTEDAKLRLEVNMQALRAQFERDLQVMQRTVLFVRVNFRLYIFLPPQMPVDGVFANLMVLLQ
jgi:hypothetical protein